MAQFIHLSLLLATIQLPLVSVTKVPVCLLEGCNVTFKCLPPQPITHCCRNNMCECVPGSGLLRVTVTDNSTMTINNLKLEDSRKYIYCSPHQADWFLYLNVTRGLQFHQEAKSWIDALEHCRSQNSTLVQITNQTVQEAVNSLLQNKTDRMQDGVWIGLERSIFGNIVPWLWISGSEATNFAWNSSFPVDRLNNHCGKIIHVKESEFKWLDANCHNKLPFICQSLNERPCNK